ncbi:hypothetical protein JCM8547_001911 [Rhodosporidiobolus lusitaniae]
MVFRRFSTSSSTSSTKNQRSPPLASGSPPSAASSASRSRMSAPAGAPPPPSYNAALRSSVDGAATGGVARANPNTGQRVQRRSSVEDRLAPLGRYDVFILVDDSPSMLENDNWSKTREALVGVVEAIARYDKDGIDLSFLNNEDRKLENVTSPQVVADMFDAIQPFGSTPTGVVMDEILRDYVESVEDARGTKTRVKPLLLLILTDGRADDPDMVKDICVEMAQRLDEVRAPPYQLGVQFVQIGDDPEAREFLQDLDDNLKPQLGVRDMIDTTPYEGAITPEFILKAALGAVVKSIDG